MGCRCNDEVKYSAVKCKSTGHSKGIQWLKIKLDDLIILSLIQETLNLSTCADSSNKNPPRTMHDRLVCQDRNFFLWEPFFLPKT